MPAAAVLQQEQRDVAKGVEIGAIDDRAALTFCRDEVGAGEDGQVRRHGILRHLAQAREFAGRNAVGLIFHELTERIHARGLGEAAKAAIACTVSIYPE